MKNGHEMLYINSVVGIVMEQKDLYGFNYNVLITNKNEIHWNTRYTIKFTLKRMK